MGKKPKDPINSPRGGDDWGIGQQADGSINVVPPDELDARIAQRNADDEAFGALLADEDEDED